MWTSYGLAAKLAAMTDEQHTPAPVTQLQRKLVGTGMFISDFPDTDRPEYLHALLCQLGLPRARTPMREFIRTSGNASMMLTAGKRFTGQGWQDCPLPYGTKPRLTLIHLCSEAVRTQNPVIDVGDGLKPFLSAVGIPLCGKNWSDFKNQMTYLACSEMNFAFTANGKITQTRFNPIDSFSAWAAPDTDQRGFWPDEIALSPRFFETLCEHAVPLDPRAIHALQSSALAMDAYTWLAHRLCRVKTNAGVKLSWANLKEQFGQEYKTAKDFKKEFRAALRKALCVYPDARVSEEMGGIRLYPSSSPVKRATVSLFKPKE